MDHRFPPARLLMAIACAMACTAAGAGVAYNDVAAAGHTDDRGGDSYNFDLSRRRAQSVVEYLNDSGIEPSRMDARGYGESQPMDSNSTAAGRERNRRVEFRVVSN